MERNRTEACGRCSMTTVVDAVDSDGESSRDPFGDDAIEVDETVLRRVSPAAWLGQLVDRIDAAVSRFIYGR
ncbi:hypothetical protein HTG_03565 [Natrinema mahii]|nr:hypothetical protein HTG_03565 [Natrinema mahii]